MIKRIRACWFSPAGTTKKVTEYLAGKLAEYLQLPVVWQPYTLPEEREQFWTSENNSDAAPQTAFTPEDLLVWATPVYAGRIPNKTLDFVKENLRGQDTLAVPVVVYGNRSYDNALSELTGIMKDNGCRPIGAAAVVARHAFSDTLAKGRPDEKDFALLDRLAEQVAEKLRLGENIMVPGGENAACVSVLDEAHPAPLTVPGEAHPEKYYVPLKEDGTPAKFLKAKPSLTPDLCTGCGICQTVCPMGSIVMTGGEADRTVPEFAGVCIKCQACRRSCPNGAIFFADTDFLSHKKMVEGNYQAEKKTEIFV